MPKIKYNDIYVQIFLRYCYRYTYPIYSCVQTFNIVFVYLSAGQNPYCDTIRVFPAHSTACVLVSDEH